MAKMRPNQAEGATRGGHQEL